jgi:pilus assembly protein CpaB
MQRGRLLIIIALLLIVLSIGAIFVVLQFTGGTPTPPPDGGPTPGGEVVEVTPTPGQKADIIVAVQNIERGQVIPTEALGTWPWPTEIVPPSAITDPAMVVGARARYTIARNEPIFTTMLVQTLGQISPFGSDTAARIPAGFTALSIPYDGRNGGVAYGVRRGDYVNVIVSWAFVDIDADFQSVLPNLTSGVLGPDNLNPSTDGTFPPGSKVAGVTGGAGPAGRGETDPTLNVPFYLVPSEAQRSRVVSQSIIQNALVLGLGEFPQDAPTVLEIIPPTPVPTATPEGTPPPPPPTPTETPLPPTLITVAVSPQEALVLDYVMRLRQRYPNAVHFTYTLRSAGDTTLAETQSVTLRYMMETYNISLPEKLAYGLDGVTLPAQPPQAPAAP